MADDIKAYGAYLAETKHSSQNTISSYLRDLHQFHDYVQDTLEADLRQVTTEEIQAYVSWMLGKGKSPASATRSVASLKSFYGYLVSIGALKINPAKGVTAAKVERKYPQILTSKEVELG